MKKVFRIWKYLEVANQHGYIIEAIDAIKVGWPLDCEGLTGEEMNKKGYLYSDNWLEVEEE